MKQALQFDLLKREGAQMFAALIAQLQLAGVGYHLTQDYNMVYVEIT